MVFGGNSWQKNVKENEKITKCLANGEFTRAGRATIFNVATSGNATTGYNKKNVCPLEIIVATVVAWVPLGILKILKVYKKALANV